MSLAEWYSGIVRWIGDGTGAEDTVLHIHAGMAVLLLARIVTRRSLATLLPLSFVYAAAFAKEAADYLAYRMMKPDTLSDIVNTVVWPTILFVGLRARRARAAQGDAIDVPSQPG